VENTGAAGHEIRFVKVQAFNLPRGTAHLRQRQIRQNTYELSPPLPELFITKDVEGFE
jgi:hypothetical protein